MTTETDASGNFETPDFLVFGDVNVIVSGDIETSTGELKNVSLYNQSLKPASQSVHRLDLNLRSQLLRVQVSDSTGTPIAGARVELRGRGGRRQLNTKSDEQGQAELTFMSEGECVVKVSAGGYATNSVKVDTNEPGFDGEVQVELRGSVTCAGLADLTAFDIPELGDGVYLRITGPADSSWNQLDVDDLSDDRRASFRVGGLMPGEYKAQLWVNGNLTEPISFELREGGDENLLFAFQPADDGQ